MIQYDTYCYDSYDSQTCLNLFRFKWFIWYSNMSKRVLNSNTKFCKIWVNGTKCKDKKENARTTQKAIHWIAASKSSDQKLSIKVNHFPSISQINWSCFLSRFQELIGNDCVPLTKISRGETNIDQSDTLCKKVLYIPMYTTEGK